MPWAMHISLVQQGLIVQQEFAKLVMMGSKGRIELAPPLTDDERRDWELHVRGQFGFGLAVQVKSTMHLQTQGGVRATPILHSFFKVPIKHLVSSPFFYYFFGYLDAKLMCLADPAFLIPSTFFHKHAGPNRRGAYIEFNFLGSMSPKSHDRWRPYQVNTLEVGEKVLEIMADLKRRRVPVDEAASLLSMPDALRVQLTKGSALPILRKRPA